MKRILIIATVLLALFSCKREAPRSTDSFLLEFRMPEECLSSARYKNRTVLIQGSSASYQFQTDPAGQVTVESVIPGIYDITTSWEMSGAQYKALLKEASTLPDNVRVIVGASLMNQQLFTAQDMQIDLTAAVVQGLMISKVYYAGTKDALAKSYDTDAYIELFNNSDEVVYLDGKYLGLADNDNPAKYVAQDHPDSIYMRQICRFPGSGTDIPVQPGGSVVIAAQSAQNHLANGALSSVDLSQADFEVKVIAGSGNPDVPMLELIHSSWPSIKTLNLNRGTDNGVVLFETEQAIYDSWPQVYPVEGGTQVFKRIPKSVVIDGVECLKNNVSGGPNVNDKRLQQDVDAGYQFINAVSGLNHESVERRVSRFENGRYYLKDTNNSTADFAVCTDPTQRKYDKEELQ